MKKFYFIAAIIAIATVACSKNEQPGQDSANQIKSFTMSMPDMQKGTETKTGLILDAGKYNKLVWKENDRVYVSTPAAFSSHGHDGPYNYYETTANDVTIAGFSYAGNAGGDVADDTNYFVTYGASPRSSSGGHIKLVVPGTQSYVENGIASNTMPMFGYGSDLNNMGMKCYANILRLNLYASEGGVKVTKIELTPTEVHDYWYSIAGSMAIAIGTYASAYADPTSTSLWSVKGGDALNKVTYNCGSGVALASDAEHATAFNIVFSRHLSDKDANFIRATITYVKGSDPTIYTRTKVLSNLTKDKRHELGKIYTFGAKNISDTTPSYWDE